MSVLSSSSSSARTTGGILDGNCLRGLLFLREGGIQTDGIMNPSRKRIRRVGRRTWCWIRRCRRRRRWRPASCDGTRGWGCPRRPSRRGRTPRPTRQNPRHPRVHRRVPPRGEEGGATPCASTGEGGPVTAWGRGRGGVGERRRGSEERESEGERDGVKT